MPFAESRKGIHCTNIVVLNVIKTLDTYFQSNNLQYRHIIPSLIAWAARKRPHARLVTQSPGHGCMDDVTTERSFDSRGTCLNDVLVSSLTCYLCCTPSGLADIRSTGAGIKCLYCTAEYREYWNKVCIVSCINSKDSFEEHDLTEVFKRINQKHQ